VDLRALRYFVAVADAHSFTVAADDLDISQPALSQAVKRLEGELGCGLFVRNRQNPSAGLRLTSAGEVLYAEATVILATVARAERRVRRVGGRRDAVRVAVGFASSTPSELVTAALTLSEARPRLEVVPVHVAWGEEHAFLRDGRVDLVFLQYPRDATLPGYVVRTVAQRPRVLLLPTNHPLATRTEVTRADIANEPLLDPGFADVPEMHRDFWLGEPRPQGAAGPFVVPLEMRTVEEMCACVAAGKGLAIASSVIAEVYSRPDVVFVPMTDLAPVEIGIARLRNERRTEVLEAFGVLAGDDAREKVRR
jgi:DNA-binding transcriptional LysR family regulator